jgi:hypothetical protein
MGKDEDHFFLPAKESAFDKTTGVKHQAGLATTSCICVCVSSNYNRSKCCYTAT